MPLNLIKRCTEFRDIDVANQIPPGRRGICVLYCRKQQDAKDYYDVVYVGRALKGIKGRILRHMRKLEKNENWTHFSAFEVRDGVSDDLIIELEGLFRHIYRKDSRTTFNDQRGFKLLADLLQDDLKACQ